jgi:hypothetical protein
LFKRNFDRWVPQETAWIGVQLARNWRRLSGPAIRFSRMWGSSSRASFVLATIGVFALCYAWLLLPTDAVDFLAEEDGGFESLGALGFLVGSVLCFLAFLRTRRAPHGTYGRVKQGSILLLALGLFFAAGEEISWGQRILGLGTPESLSEVNAQDELNIHNLGALQGWFQFDRLFQVFWFSFGVIIPIAAAVSARVRTVLGRYIPILPLWITVLFVAHQLLGEIAQAALDDSDLFNGTLTLTQSRVEITEALSAVIFALVGYVLFSEARRAGAPATEPPADSRDRRRPAAKTGRFAAPPTPTPTDNVNAKLGEEDTEYEIIGLEANSDAASREGWFAP